MADYYLYNPTTEATIPLERPLLLRWYAQRLPLGVLRFCIGNRILLHLIAVPL
jgi:hypothetical protein